MSETPSTEKLREIRIMVEDAYADPDAYRTAINESVRKALNGKPGYNKKGIQIGATVLGYIAMELNQEDAFKLLSENL